MLLVSPGIDLLSVCHDSRYHVEIDKYILTILKNFTIIHPSNIYFYITLKKSRIQLTELVKFKSHTFESHRSRDILKVFHWIANHIRTNIIIRGTSCSVSLSVRPSKRLINS